MRRVYILSINILIFMTMTSFTLPELPYAKDALAPILSSETLEYHHDKHHAAYVTNLNNLIKGTEFENMDLTGIVRKSDGAIFNNAAQVWNHTFYFEQFGHKTQIEGALADKIKSVWGSIDNFKKEFNAAGASLFGSGWVWLVSDDKGDLRIVKESNAGNPMVAGLKPLMTFDVWEHAYYIDYRNARAKYLESLWEILDWSVIEKRYK